MVFRPRTRQLRRAVVVAALGALVVPATAGAATKKTPVITKVTPKTAYVGAKLTITGKNFKRGKAKNSVQFRADGGKTLFVKADVSTAKKLTVKLPKTLEKYMATKGGQPVATRFRVRVLAAKLGKSFTAPKVSPVIAPERIADTGDASDGAGVPTAPDGDCDADGVLNRVDLDDDNDLLADTLELSLELDPCVGDTDGDGVEDGFEYQSAIDLNNDDYQSPNDRHPVSRARRRTRTRSFKDADVDYDGDALTLSDEYKLWKYTYEVNHTRDPHARAAVVLGRHQYSLSVLVGGNGRRQATMARGRLPAAEGLPAVGGRRPATAATTRPAAVDARPSPHAPGRRPRPLRHGPRRRRRRPRASATGNQRRAERTYWDLDPDGFVSDDERDEDADGLNNYYEVSGGPMSPELLGGVLQRRDAVPDQVRRAPSPTTPTATATASSTAPTTRTSTTSRTSWSSAATWPATVPIQATAATRTTSPYDAAARRRRCVNPFNPCLPDLYSRTCLRHPAIGDGVPAVRSRLGAVRSSTKPSSRGPAPCGPSSFRPAAAARG